MALALSTSMREGGATVSVRGPVDLHSSGDLKQHLDDLIQGGALDLIVDFSDVDFCDSSGLGALVAAYKQAQAAGGMLQLRGAHGKVARLLRITGLERVLTLGPPAGGAAERGADRRS